MKPKASEVKTRRYLNPLTNKESLVIITSMPHCNYFSGLAEGKHSSLCPSCPQLPTAAPSCPPLPTQWLDQEQRHRRPLVGAPRRQVWTPSLQGLREVTVYQLSGLCPLGSRTLSNHRCPNKSQLSQNKNLQKWVSPNISVSQKFSKLSWSVSQESIVGSLKQPHH